MQTDGIIKLSIQSGREDSNLRPLDPQSNKQSELACFTALHELRLGLNGPKRTNSGANSGAAPVPGGPSEHWA